METIQELFDRAPMGILTLEKGEYEGPLILNRPCSVDGRKSLLWANYGPVVQVAAGPATLRNFRIEVNPLQPDPLENLAVAVVFGEVHLEHVEVAGEVLGVPEEETGWNLPRLVALGAFAAGRENRFTLELDLPGAAELLWEAPKLRAVPDRLHPGKNQVTVTLPAMGNGAALCVPLWVHTVVSRRILLTGRALAGAQALEADALVSGAPLAILRNPGSAFFPSPAGETLMRGQRRSLNDLPKEPVILSLSWNSPPPSVEPCPYAFLLGADGKVQREGDLVCPGNPIHRSGAAILSREGGPGVVLRLSELPAAVERLLVCFAPPAGGDFSTVRDPALRLFSREQEIFRFPLDRLHRQQAVAAAEFYRYRGEWRLNPIGMGYGGGLPKLCADYGAIMRHVP